LRSKKKLKAYDNKFCLFTGSDGLSESCMEHSEELAIGNKWYQFIAEDEDNYNYY
jgi:hypothetical protein